MDIKIIYEDESFIVIDKPSGITVNRSDTTKEEGTVQDWAEKQFTIDHLPLTIDREGDFYNRRGVVHRLDKETSGILLIAKNPASFLNLQKQFKERRVEKTYVALVHGEVKPESGEINVPVGRLSFNRKRFGVVAGGREANTVYRVISNFKFPRLPKPGTGGQAVSNEKLTLLELKPKTGRTHQIRVHLKYINHPIFADPLYAGRKVGRDDRKLLPRLFLHASEISFNHPASLKSISFQSPLPEELVEFMLKLDLLS